MSYTAFGEFTRILRVKNHQVMKDMAEILGVTNPYLSSVETGKKNVPSEWVDRLIESYNLTEKEIQTLREAAENSKTAIKVSLVNEPQYKRELAIKFAQKFESLDEETAEKIVKLLKN